ncbi:hypothetical protein V6N12_054027 [Hibiscus sabdariffa]|uniref:Uncharacterized protein n=1 Tax=Hibiscus sabdariffa TaxID=183260 RepID=A0ABR2D9A5_9ROSI
MNSMQFGRLHSYLRLSSSTPSTSTSTGTGPEIINTTTMYLHVNSFYISFSFPYERGEACPDSTMSTVGTANVLGGDGVLFSGHIYECSLEDYGFKDWQKPDGPKRSTADMSIFVQNLLEQMSELCDIYCLLNSGAMDEMGDRIIELENSINDLRAEIRVDCSPSPLTPLKQRSGSAKKEDGSA